MHSKDVSVRVVLDMGRAPEDEWWRRTSGSDRSGLVLAHAGLCGAGGGVQSGARVAGATVSALRPGQDEHRTLHCL
jgi:hypothetical protein